MNRSTMMLAAGGVVVLAGVAGWFRPMPRPASATTAHQTAWRLPTAAELERSSIEQFAAIRGVTWVGDGGAGGGDPSAQWTLRGIVGRFDDRAVLVQVGSDPLIKRLQSGDTLPDGSRLVAVERNGIVVERDGCRTQRPLYPLASNVPQDPADGCASPGTDKETPLP